MKNESPTDNGNGSRSHIHNNIVEHYAVDLTPGSDGDLKFVASHHQGSYPFYGWYKFVSNAGKGSHNGGTVISPSVPFNNGLEDYLHGIGETDAAGEGCWILQHDGMVFPAYFGAYHNGIRPSKSTSPANGNDDTIAVKATCSYLQSAAFQPNLYVTFSGGFTFALPANTFTVVSGDNPLGTTRPRSTASGDPGTYARQNWFVDGQMSSFLWNIHSADDRFIESHETFTRQKYSRFTVVPCNMGVDKGVFYSNIANPGRNATTIHEFDFVQIEPVGLDSELLKTIGLKRLFQYFGTNLGDRLYTNACEFRQFKEGVYTENLEAVSQRFIQTSFVNYVDHAIFFHIRKHGSGFSVSGCELLAKGDNQTILKTDRLDGEDNGVAGATSQFEILPSRLETTSNKKITIVDADFGIIDIYNLIQTAGGLPDPASYAFIQRGNAIINVYNCHIHGGIKVAYRDNTNRTVKRKYSVKLDGCMFTRDLSDMLAYERADGITVPYGSHREEQFDPVPPVIVKNTNSTSVSWQGLPNSNKFVFDRNYFTDFDLSALGHSQIKIGKWRKSSGMSYLNNETHCIMPVMTQISSIIVTTKKSSYGFVRFILGDTFIDVDTNTADQVNRELLVGQHLTTNGTSIAGRTLRTEVYDTAGNVVSSPSQAGTAIIGYREEML
ncbi:hypothetical protein [Paenibacillus oceani]|uniref:Uncharacterized protein n=1 Tax=Paenibacillus oceani TaxID=2772510 RepID=A0A927H2M0_9BACL|nr:hypothetical protein [Paenibacillus oceani]MBD2865503.1 hypothetical protein [Paenibacillus oceani]